jgi:hypothetical protein
VGVLGSVYVAVRLYAPGWGEQGIGGARQGKKEVFFFEKKKQKTFAPWSRASSSGTRQVIRAQKQKFFGSFFQKRTCLPCFSFALPRAGSQIRAT